MVTVVVKIRNAHRDTALIIGDAPPLIKPGVLATSATTMNTAEIKRVTALLDITG
jgi:hypothetical protein